MSSLSTLRVWLLLSAFLSLSTACQPTVVVSPTAVPLPTKTATPAIPTTAPTAVVLPSRTPPPSATPQPTNTPTPTPVPSPTTAVVTSRAIGFSHDNHPIISYQIGTGETHVMFVGGMHGGYEWNTILLAYEALDYFLAQPDLVPANVTLHIIPSANPDGQKYATGSTGRFDPADVIFNTVPGRFNGRGVDLNRNWDCDWQPTAQWRDELVSGGDAAFSEPESRALRDYILAHDPTAVVFWHSAANAIFSAYCPDQHLPSDQLAELYSAASGYPVRYTFSAYPITGDASNWLAAQGIASMTVELTTHSTIEWERNRLGITAVLNAASRNN